MFHRAAKAYNWFYNKTLVRISQRKERQESSLRGMSVRYMSPSSIHFMFSDDDGIMCTQFDVTDLSERILADGQFPKLQAVHKDGFWFTLNNLQLEVCRKLELDGRCSNVQVNIVSLKNVPEQMKKMMVAPKHIDGSDTSRVTCAGYQKLDQTSTNVDARANNDCSENSDESDDDDDDDEDNEDEEGDEDEDELTGSEEDGCSDVDGWSDDNGDAGSTAGSSESETENEKDRLL